MKDRSSLYAVLAMLAFGLLPGLAAAQTPFKLYISADMEGVAGVVSDQQILPSGFEYSRFREFMTAEVNTVIEAAFAAGVTEIVVSDSHGNGQNLLIEKFPKKVSVVRSWPRPLMMMEGIDASFAGVVLLGYHTSTHNEAGVRAHTLSSARLADVRINDKQVGEGEISAAIAGHFGVPVIMVTGDDQLVKELQGSLGNVEGAVVKWAHGFHSARTLTPAEANDAIRAATARALGRLKSFKPYKVATPVRFDLRFKSYRQADMLSYLPIVERIDSHTVRYVAKDMPAASKFVEFAVTYEADMDP
ncbi:D-aminopeptidase DppA [Steroidobacter agaridevorans]|uniref:D-aminopeptidase DppA n=1 Tax=Steroidobacter agaridevorans TaxID=2695856 RepID=A0A829YHA4_9GAMM|nr:M55 family metallopeptidase [Steroidobacter agaridevorans]GFE82600.1 D-aminopeptidase DppA [Steroidobacter agaridevorans]